MASRRRPAGASAGSGLEDRVRLALVLLAAVKIGAAADVSWSVGKLRSYCAGCHAIGEVRFIRSDDDNEVWKFLFENRAPKSGKIWAEGIREALNWPTDKAPPVDQMLQPPDRDWMPKGVKRTRLAADVENGTSARKRLIQELAKAF